MWHRITAATNPNTLGHSGRFGTVMLIPSLGRFLRNGLPSKIQRALPEDTRVGLNVREHESINIDVASDVSKKIAPTRTFLFTAHLPTQGRRTRMA